MVVGVGMDLAEIDRIGRSVERFGERFLDRVLTPGEKAIMPAGPPARAAYVAARFAAKEAALKALGTGMAEGLTLRDVEVIRLASGQPLLRLHGKAEKRAQAMGVNRMHISLTHSRTTAGAVVILERADAEDTQGATT